MTNIELIDGDNRVINDEIIKEIEPELMANQQKPIIYCFDEDCLTGNDYFFVAKSRSDLLREILPIVFPNLKGYQFDNNRVEEILEPFITFLAKPIIENSKINNVVYTPPDNTVEVENLSKYVFGKMTDLAEEAFSAKEKPEEEKPLN